MKRTCRLLGLAVVALFLICAFTPVPNILGRWVVVPARIAPAGAIVVLGSALHPDGTLTASSLRRAVYGVVLQREGWAPLLVFAGHGSGAGQTEAEVRARLARDLGVPHDRLLTETQARTTREEANRIGHLLHQRGIRRILLVTDWFHMYRARQIFTQEGFEVLAAPSGDVSTAMSTPAEQLHLFQVIVQGLLARGYYAIPGLR